MTSANRIRAYVRRYFPGAHAECRVHGCNRGSVLVFRDHALQLDWEVRTTEWGGGDFDVSLPELGRTLRKCSSPSADQE